MSTTKGQTKVKSFFQQKNFGNLLNYLVKMDLSRPPSSRRGGYGANEMSSASSGRIGTASRLSSINVMPNRLGTAKNIGIPQKVTKRN